ncbi:carbohydrate ABC transporter permease [Paenibacillus pinihumi]|uniref:carbohydrate ABC transporter permease n=1 Tax=Paenibacillus pinihumi TaxID=669462 RepID=UPI000416A4A5|nr:carbohydrate ABC transporter permease [Paenibacillus pinihumi]
MNKLGVRLVGTVTNALVMLFSLSAIFPLIWMGYTSLKTNKEFSLNIVNLPTKPVLDNYVSAFDVGDLSSALFSSSFNAVISVPLIVLFSFVIGYFFSRFNFRGKPLLMAVLMLGMLIPVHSLLVPLFVQLNTLGMLDHRLTLLLPYIAINLPLTSFLFLSFIRDIPAEIEEAAYIDGSTFDRTLFTVVFPVCMPMIATATILNVLHTWNEMPFALILNKSAELFTLPVWLTFFSSQYSTDYTGKIAGLVITSLPTVILYLFFSQKIMNGMTAGAVKG